MTQAEFDKLAERICAEHGVLYADLFQRSPSRAGFGRYVADARREIARQVCESGVSRTQCAKFLKVDRTTISHTLNRHTPRDNVVTR